MLHGYASPGDRAVLRGLQNGRVEEMLERIPSGKLGTIVILDELEDPHNLGAVLRTCDAVGADGVILRKNRSVSLNSTVAKVSTGAIETVPVAMVANLTQTLKQLKEKGYWVYGTDMRNAQDYRQPTFDTPVALVIGLGGQRLPAGQGRMRRNADAADGKARSPR